MSSTPAVFSVLCKGRNAHNEEVLENPVVADVTIKQGRDNEGKDNNSILLTVHCAYNHNRRGYSCDASDDSGRCGYATVVPSDGI